MVRFRIQHSRISGAHGVHTSVSTTKLWSSCNPQRFVNGVLCCLQVFCTPDNKTDFWRAQGLSSYCQWVERYTTPITSACVIPFLPASDCVIPCVRITLYFGRNENNPANVYVWQSEEILFLLLSRSESLRWSHVLASLCETGFTLVAIAMTHLSTTWKR